MNFSEVQRKGDKPEVKNYAHLMGDWLNTKGWTHWCTLTTPYELTQSGARRLANRFHEKLSKNAGYTEMYWASEPFDVKAGQHIHALLKVPPGLPYEAITRTYQAVTGSEKWSRIQVDEFNANWKKEGSEDHEEGKGAAYYVGKYITKKLSDYDYLTTIKKPRRRKRKRA